MERHSCHIDKLSTVNSRISALVQSDLDEFMVVFILSRLICTSANSIVVYGHCK